MDQNNFPLKSKVINGIKNISSMTLPIFDENMDVKEYVKTIMKIIEDECGMILHLSKPTKQNSFKLPIYRVREFNDIANPDLFHEHSYPPSNVVKMGRCNFPKYPVFYGSTDPTIAILEVLRSHEPADRIYCISVWDIEPTDDEFLLQTFLNVPLPKENIFAKINHNLKEKLKAETFKGNVEISDDQLDAIELYLKYFDYQFINANNYSISAALAHNSLYMDHTLRTDILMYPSVQAGMKGINLAISPNFVDNNMKLRRLYTIKAGNIDLKKGCFNLSFGKFGLIGKNVIYWQVFDIDNPECLSLINQDFKSISPILHDNL